MKIANRGNEEIYIILFVKEAWTSYFRMSLHKVGEHLKKCVQTKIPLIFYWFLLFFISNSLEKQTENSGVLLNWLTVAINENERISYEYLL